MYNNIGVHFIYIILCICQLRYKQYKYWKCTSIRNRGQCRFHWPPQYLFLKVLKFDFDKTEKPISLQYAIIVQSPLYISIFLLFFQLINLTTVKHLENK